MCKFSPFKTEKCHREINKDLKNERFLMLMDWEVKYCENINLP